MRAGETPPSDILTGPAKAQRLVCALEPMSVYHSRSFLPRQQNMYSHLLAMPRRAKPQAQRCRSAQLRRPQLNVERLEDRTVPAVLNLGPTSTASSFAAFGAVFQTNQTQPAGSGVIN